MFFNKNKKVQKQKRNYSGRKFNFHPAFSFIIQFFNKKENIKQLFDAFADYPDSELIVIDDGSVDGSTSLWLKLLKDKNHNLIVTNDLHEIITYQKALGLARGKYCVFLQDDDLPENFDWLMNAKKLFEQDEKLIILGGNAGLTLLTPEPAYKNPARNVYSVKDNIGGAPGVQKYILYTKPEFKNKQNIHFQYVMAVNRAPMIVKRKEYIEIGGFNQDFAPFQCDDVYSCITAWQKGYHVGLIASDFKRDINIGGMRKFNAHGAGKQAEKNWKKIYRLFGAVIEKKDLTNLILKKNETTLKKIEKNHSRKK